MSEGRERRAAVAAGIERGKSSRPARKRSIEGLLSRKFFDPLRSSHRSGAFRDMMKRALVLAVVLSLAAEQIKQAINRAVFAAS